MAYKVKDINGKPVLFNGSQIMAQDSFETRIEDHSDKERSFLAVASAESPDRMGDEIKVSGWKLEDYRKNPVVMPFHDYHTLPVGRSLEEFTKRKRLMFRPQFATYPESMKMYEMYRDKYLKGFSVGFVPLKSEYIDPERSDYCAPVRFLEHSLLEVSVAPVPAHQDALAEIKSMVKKGELYIPARFLEEDKTIQIEDYDNCIHAIVNDKGNFANLYIMDFEKGKIIYGPYKGEDEKENHVHCFIFTEIEGLEDKDIEEVVTEKMEGKIEFINPPVEYDGKSFTEKETVLITLIPSIDEKGFIEEEVKEEEEKEEKLGEGDDDAGGYLVPEEEVIKPLPSEHACRIQDPDKYDEFKRATRDHEGKEYSIIFGIKDGEAEEQSYRYNKDVWTEAEAKEHCKDHEGTFEAASEKILEKEEGGSRLFVVTMAVPLEAEEMENLEKVISSKLPENSKLLILPEGSVVSYIKVGDVEKLEIIQVEEKIGAVLSKANRSKLEKAILLVSEVMESSEKEEESSDKDKEADTIIKIVDSEKELESQDTISLPETSSEEIAEMIATSIKRSLGKIVD